MTMTKKLISILALAFLMLGAFTPALSGLGVGETSGAITVLAEGDGGTLKDTLPFDKTDKDLGSQVKPDEQADSGALNGIIQTMYTFAKYASMLIFGVSALMIVWAGFKYATSQGESRTTETAKMQIIYSGVGIGVALFAMVIVQVFADIYSNV